jgi:hypothetical protein
VSQYEDPQYLDALQYLVEDERVRALGLCNFDTQHMEKALAHGVEIHSNQVQVTSIPPRYRKRLMPVPCCECQLTKEQFSLIDSRPTMKMGEVCLKENIKLLTYGTLVRTLPLRSYLFPLRANTCDFKCGGFLSDKWLGAPEPGLYDQSITPSQRKVSPHRAPNSCREAAMNRANAKTKPSTTA